MAPILPTGARGRALALAITVLAAALLWLGAAVPLRDWYDARQQRLDALLAKADRMHALAAALPALRRRAAARVTAPEQAGLVAGATDALAAASLQSALEAMAQQAGTSLGSTETLPASPAPGGMRAIRVRASVRAPWPAFLALLRRIDESPVRMVADDLHLHALLPPPHDGDLAVEASFAVTAFRNAAGHGAGR